MLKQDNIDFELDDVNDGSYDVISSSLINRFHNISNYDFRANKALNSSNKYIFLIKTIDKFEIISVPILVIMGIIGNLLGVICLLRNQMLRRHTVLFILAIIGMIDNLFLLTQFQRWIDLYSEKEQKDKLLVTNLFCKVYIFLLRFTMLSSNSLLLALLIIRFIKIYFGKYYLSLSSNIGQMCSRLCVVYIIALTLSVNWHQVWTSGVHDTDNRDDQLNNNQSLNEYEVLNEYQELLDDYVYSNLPPSTSQPLTEIPSTTTSTIYLKSSALPIMTKYDDDTTLTDSVFKCMENIKSEMLAEIINYFNLLLSITIYVLLFLFSILLIYKIHFKRDSDEIDYNINISYTNSPQRVIQNEDKNLKRLRLSSSTDQIKIRPKMKKSFTTTEIINLAKQENSNFISPSSSKKSVLLPMTTPLTKKDIFRHSTIITPTGKQDETKELNIYKTISLSSKKSEKRWSNTLSIQAHDTIISVEDEESDELNKKQEESCNKRKPKKRFTKFLVLIALMNALFGLIYILVDMLSYKYIQNERLIDTLDDCLRLKTCKIKHIDSQIINIFKKALLRLPLILINANYSLKFYLLFIMYNKFRLNMYKFLNIRLFINFNLLRDHIKFINLNKPIAVINVDADENNACASADIVATGIELNDKLSKKCIKNAQNYSYKCKFKSNFNFKKKSLWFSKKKTNDYAKSTKCSFMDRMLNKKNVFHDASSTSLEGSD